jgi:ribosomal protein S12 methylthiotransferase
MKTRPSGIRIVTMGCSKNLVDSETLLRQFRANELKVFHNDDKGPADTVIINTCGFIQDAKQESVDMILHYAEMKTKGLLKRLYVMGCLSERYTNELKNEIPEIDGIFGVSEFERITNSLGLNFKNELLGERMLTTPAHYAYLKISEGCSRSCSFCAIPKIRGPHISKKPEDVLAEAEFLAAAGIKEIILVAQDLSYYGFDLNKQFQLPALVENLARINGPEWIRLHYAFPANFPFDITRVMNNSPKVCRYLDIPLQHISDNMLKLMRRGITRKKSIDLIEKLRKEVPGIALRTTMLVGHPGETDKDFSELMDFVKEAEFERLGVFTYSHEEDTHAFNTMTNSIPSHMMQARADELMKLQEGISEKLNLERVGREFKVLVDRKEGDYFIGRTEFDSPEVDNEVLVKVSDKLKTGEFYNVKITGSDHFDLFGEVVQSK